MRFPALRHRDFTIFWVAHIVSRIGTQMRDVALAWHLYSLTKSPVALGLLGAFRAVPIVVFALGGGVAADRWDRRRLMIVTQLLLTGISAAMAIVTTMGVVTPHVLYGLIALASVTAAFDNPAQQALVANLLPPEDLPNGLTLRIFGWQVATVIGPAVGGVLLAATSIEALYAIDAASFFAVLGALFLVRPLKADVASSAGAAAISAWESLLEAVRFLRTKPVLVHLMLLDFFATLFAGSLLLLPIFADEVFRVGEKGLGIMLTAPAVGSVAASAWMSIRPPVKHLGRTVLVAVACYGVSVALFGVSTSFPLALLFLAGSGAADSVSTVVRNIARQTLTPDAMRGRMTAFNMVFFASGPQLGEVEAGFVAARWGVRSSVVSGGLLCIVVGALAAAGSRSLRQLRVEAPTNAKT